MLGTHAGPSLPKEREIPVQVHALQMQIKNFLKQLKTQTKT